MKLFIKKCFVIVHGNICHVQFLEIVSIILGDINRNTLFGCQIYYNMLVDICHIPLKKKLYVY